MDNFTDAHCLCRKNKDNVVLYETLVLDKQTSAVICCSSFERMLCKLLPKCFQIASFPKKHKNRLPTTVRVDGR